MNIKWFRDIKKGDIGQVGGKGLNLGIMYNLELPVPAGFCVTADAYKLFLEKAGIKEKIKEILSKINIEDSTGLGEISEEIEEVILNSEIPIEIQKEIKDAYDHLNVNIDVYKMAGESALNMIKAGRDLPYVAVRSSATAEDLPEASFAGQQATYLNIRGSNNVVDSVRKCWASLFTARAIYYREKNNFDHMEVLISVVVQRMVNSDKAGVMFTINPSTNKEDEIMIEACFGLGEALVSGSINPDNYIVSKGNLKIIHKKIMEQDWGFFRDEHLGRTVKRKLADSQKNEQVLEEDDIKKLAKYGEKIEEHYKIPMDIEYALEGKRIFILQARPVTTFEKSEVKEGTAEKSGESKEEILSGLAASPGVASGKVRIVHDITELSKIEKGDILVTRMTNPDYVVAMEKAIAIVTDEGGVTAHAAIVSRELGVPCVVGTEKATHILKEGQEITVDGATGKVYSGKVEIAHQEEKIEYNGEPIITGTKIFMNLGEPSKIDDYKNLPFDGIGLMRLEFLITSSIGEHPLHMIEEGRSQEYIDKMSKGISKVAGAINPRPLIVRFSDFKTNEYRNLKGGDKYEAEENNPMIGWRGVSRYIDKEFIEAFKLEVRAIKKVREQWKNVHVMLPFVRTVDGAKETIDILREMGLENTEDFDVFLMAEVPCMALIPEKFAELDIDGVSIGSNDLTQLVLGVDRDSAKLGKLGFFDERDPAVLEAISRIIKGFKSKGKKVGICGQAPSYYPEIVEFLIKHNIDSISVNPDVVVKVRVNVASVERKILLEKK
ncbi:phosphoenolpyruvate synthase [archaeon]|nr:phosphoenolpyruvate synthase [archaeon]